MIELNSTFFAQILNFLILVILLRAVAYKPVLKILKEREDRIAASIDKADADAAEAAKTLEAYKAELAGARTKAQEIMDLAEKRASEEHEASIQATKRRRAVKGRGCHTGARGRGQDRAEESGEIGQRRHHRRVYRETRRA